jgi:hypothetical protein
VVVQVEPSWRLVLITEHHRLEINLWARDDAACFRARRGQG